MNVEIGHEMVTSLKRFRRPPPEGADTRHSFVCMELVGPTKAPARLAPMDKAGTVWVWDSAWKVPPTLVRVSCGGGSAMLHFCF